MLKLENIVKEYKGKVVLDNVSLTLDEGDVFGLLGVNGAGKTTLIKIILNLANASSGTVEFANSRKSLSDIGYLSENLSLYMHLSACENIKLFALMAGIKISQENVDNILKEVNLPNSMKQVNNFSLGMKRRLQLACVLLIKPYRILILDEPTNGLDLEGMIWFVEKIRQCHKNGQIIMISSHAISDMQDVLTHFSIINKGKISKKTRVDELVCEGVVKIRLSQEALPNLILLCKENHIRIDYEGETIVLHTNLAYSDLSMLLTNAKISVEMLNYELPKLESYFLEKIREKTV